MTLLLLEWFEASANYATCKFHWSNTRAKWKLIEMTATLKQSPLYCIPTPRAQFHFGHPLAAQRSGQGNGALCSSIMAISNLA